MKASIIKLSTCLLLVSALSFGQEDEVLAYDSHLHPNNYKHHHKAKKAHSKRHKIRIEKQNKETVQNYKMPFTKTEDDLHTLKDSESKQDVAIPQNYKMPYTNRRKQ